MERSYRPKGQVHSGQTRWLAPLGKGACNVTNLDIRFHNNFQETHTRAARCPCGLVGRCLCGIGERVRDLTAHRGEVLHLPDYAMDALLELAHAVRMRWCGPEVEVEGIVSLKTGGCPEDCHFCSQSGLFA